MTERDDQHLGDGAYVSTDGFGIWLAVNHHTNRVVYLEPAAIRELIQYCKNKGMKL